jgi:DNA-binding NarL/FixJ family response regulator
MSHPPTPPRLIRVLVAGGQTLPRTTLRFLISSSPDMQVTGEATDSTEASALAESLRPDVVVMSLQPSADDAIAAIRRLVGHRPSTDAPRIVVIAAGRTGSESSGAADQLVRALQAGASCYLDENASADDLLAAVRAAAGDLALLSPTATRHLVHRFLHGVPLSPAPGDPRPDLSVLTEREREVLALAGHGLSNEEIAQRLTLSRLTVRTHVQHAMTKLHVRSRAGLVATAYESGLIRPGAA